MSQEASTVSAQELAFHKGCSCWQCVRLVWWHGLSATAQQQRRHARDPWPPCTTLLSTGVSTQPQHATMDDTTITTTKRVRTPHLPRTVTLSRCASSAMAATRCWPSLQPSDRCSSRRCSSGKRYRSRRDSAAMRFGTASDRCTCTCLVAGHHCRKCPTCEQERQAGHVFSGESMPCRTAAEASWVAPD